MAKGRELTTKQAKFAKIYGGNGADAARKAGYHGSVQALSVTAGRLLKNAEIRKAIENRQTKESAPLIATREQRQKFWTETMNNISGDMRDRLKASELLGKSEADFVERVESGNPGQFRKLAGEVLRFDDTDDVTSEDPSQPTESKPATAS